MEEPEEPHTSQSFEHVPTTTSTPFSKIEDAVTSEGMGVLQKALFLAVILGCIAVYLRMSKVKAQTDQAYEKSLA
jgi:hypothetical protein